MSRVSIDEVSPQEWDAYNRKRINAMKDPNNYNKKGETDQESIDALDTKMETDIFEPSKFYHHETDHIKNVSNQIKDNVNNPSHYNSGAVECIDAIEAMLSEEEYIGYLRGNSLKYRWRFRYKGKPIEDLQKANWYEQRLITFMEENKNVLGSKG
jgi:transcriptional regulator of acetoin/glycerol metabolism